VPCPSVVAMSAPLVLVPGYWLGAWAWDEVVAPLRAAGHDVTALTLPGLEPGADSSSITLADHVEAIVDALRSHGRPAVLAVHSGAGASGYVVTDRVPELIARMVYVDSGPATGPLEQPDDLPFPGVATLSENENVDGISPEQLTAFAERAVTQPGGGQVAGSLKNDARLDVPTTMICTAASSADVQEWAKEGYDFIAGLTDLRDVTYVDLPTSHWPMWSRPADLAALLGDLASGS
jgi:pimeloyl-ACP methyl ester carboxylesterase